MEKTVTKYKDPEESLKAQNVTMPLEKTSPDFSELYRKHVNPVYYYLLSRVRNTADAEDLTSQTFITALENMHQLRDPDKFTPWLFRIARNKAMDYFRRARRRPTQDFNEELDQSPSILKQDDRLEQDRMIELEQLIAGLKPIEQEYIRLRLIAELPFAEIASILGKSESRIKKSYYRLLERLQAQVE
ncbi:MAG: sigma-70 family RNA polymerase sigma factor [Chloroflexi bacterium]|nr:sigma-70 family RNA polymerase sigma factor [Chloroflexota bacterium]